MPTPKGGKRPGAGRKPGSKNKRTAQLEAAIVSLSSGKPAPAVAAAPAGGGDGPKGLSQFSPPVDGDGPLMPLDFLLGVLRDENMPFPARMLAAEKAGPYCHSKLSTVEHKGGLEITAHEAALKELQ